MPIFEILDISLWNRLHSAIFPSHWRSTLFWEMKNFKFSDVSLGNDFCSFLRKNVAYNNNFTGNLSQGNQCRTTDEGPRKNQLCKFPWKYNDKVWNSCTTDSDPDGRYWCSTKVNKNLKHVGGNWGYCSQSCLNEPGTWKDYWEIFLYSTLQIFTANHRETLSLLHGYKKSLTMILKLPQRNQTWKY